MEMDGSSHLPTAGPLMGPGLGAAAPSTGEGDFCTWWHFFVAMALSGAAGVRATLPVFLLSLLHQVEPDQFPLSHQAHWLRHPEICALLGVALLVEILADQIPALDHALHAILTPVHPLMGAAAAVAPNYCGGMYTRVPMAFVGGALAGMVHSGKAMVRVGSTGSSGGLLNPVVSHCESFSTFALVVFSILSPVFAAGAAILFIIVACLGFKLIRENLNLQAPEDPSAKVDEEAGSGQQRTPFMGGSAPPYERAEDDESTSPQAARSRTLSVEASGDDQARREIDRILAAPNLHWVLGGGTSAETKQEYNRLLALLEGSNCSGNRAGRALQRLQQAHAVLHAET